MEEVLQKIVLNLSITNWMKELHYNEASIYLVGGVVRDSFLKEESKDIDIVIENLDLDEIKEILRNFGSIIENNVGDEFRVLKFKPDSWKGDPIDIATPRQDIKKGRGHKGFWTIPVKSIKEDLKRRDFTINSMAFLISPIFRKSKLIDPFNGLKDLKEGIIRATNQKAFIEDPLRILRAVQFAARFGFNIDKKTKNLMLRNSFLIKEITGERILEEFDKIFKKKGDISYAIQIMSDTNLDFAIFDGKIPFEWKFQSLDQLSFLYILSSLSNKYPHNFFMERLRGDRERGQAIQTLDQVLSFDERRIDEEDMRFMLFKAFRKSPSIEKASILPDRFDQFFINMRKGKIPMNQEDIKINGNDVIEKLGIKRGPEVGFIIELIQRDALMNRFDWKNREKSLEYLNKFKNE